MKLDITKGIQRKGVDVPFELEDAWGEDHWNGDTVAYVRPVSFSGTYMLADETVIVRGMIRAVIESPCARCLAATETSVEAEVEEAFIRDKGEEREADDDQYMYSGHVLELDEAVRTALLLERAYSRRDFARISYEISVPRGLPRAVRPVRRQPEHK